MTLPKPQKQKIVLECIFAIKSNFLRDHNALSILISQTDMIFKTEIKKCKATIAHLLLNSLTSSMQMSVKWHNNPHSICRSRFYHRSTKYIGQQTPPSPSHQTKQIVWAEFNQHNNSVNFPHMKVSLRSEDIYSIWHGAALTSVSSEEI
jgi:hypothetical protein